MSILFMAEETQISVKTFYILKVFWQFIHVFKKNLY